MLRNLIISLFLLMIFFPVDAKSNLDIIEASKEGDIETVKALLNKGAEVDTVDDTGRSLLMFAAKNGHIELVKFLLRKGADLKKKSLKGKTALFLSLEADHIEISELLLKSGAINDSSTYSELGRAYLNRGKYDQAIKYLSKAIKSNPKDLNSYWFRANSYYVLKKFDLAVSDYKEVNKLAPKFADGYGMLGWLYIKQGKFDKAERPCKKAYELAPSSYAWTVNLGHVYLFKGKIEKAKEQYRRTLLLIKKEEDLTTGPLADFELFIKNGWNVEELKRQMAWMKQEWKKEKSRRWKELNTGMEFVWIDPGSFMMGSESKEKSNEWPVHRVTLTEGFYIQTTEVTQGQWKAIMGNNPSAFSDCGDKCPVENVSWEDAQEFIKKLNKMVGTNKYRLLTEAEWEYVTRAGTRSPFFFGECLSADKANYKGTWPLLGCPEGNYRKRTVPVASFPPNAWGLYDLHGNVWEWCNDWYGKYLTEDVIDPEGPSSGKNRVVRGCGWDSLGMFCRSANRTGKPPDQSGSNVGFRLAMTRNALKDTSDQQELRKSEIGRGIFKSKGFFDGFFYVILVIVVILSFVDWLLGKKGREALKEKIGDWWLYLSEISFAGFVSKDAAKVLALLQKLFGARILSVRCFSLCAGLSILATVAIMGIVSSITGPFGKALGPVFGIKFITIYGYKLLAINATLDYVSLATTLALLSLMSKNNKLLILLSIIVLDVVVAILLARATILIGFMVRLVGFPYASFSFSLYNELLNLTIVPIVLTAIAPTLIHVMLALIFILSKAFRPLIQKPTELVLLRLAESQKGILTSVATGIGVIAKLIQEGLKVFLK